MPRSRVIRRIIDASAGQERFILAMSCGHNQFVSTLAMRLFAFAPPQVNGQWICQACPDEAVRAPEPSPTELFRRAGEPDVY